MTMNDFHYAQFLANELYNINVSEEKFEELGLLAFNKIGNKRQKLKRLITFPKKGKHELFIELPCDFEHLEAVTTLWEDWEHVTNNKVNGDHNSHWVEEYIESRKEFLDPLYVPGKYLKYERVGNTLYFHKTYGPVFILYAASELDENGLPFITDEEAEAIATWVAYIQTWKEGMATTNKNKLEMAQVLKQEWMVKCD